MSAPHRVYVVDDNAEMRKSLRWLIESVDLEVVTCASAAEFLETYREGPPACLVLDVRLRGMSGVELQEELQRRGLAIPVIVITGHADVPMAVRAMKLGAIDFIEKPFSDQVLIDRIQQAIETHARIRTAESEREELRARVEILSPREREVMALLAEGKANKEVASVLGLSTRTVEGHRARLMEKLGIDSLAQLVRIHVEVREAASRPRSSTQPAS